MIEIQGIYTKAVIYTDSIDNAVRGQLTATTIRFKDRSIPALIGTDIGCGVLRAPFQAKGKIDFAKIDKVIRENVPSGRGIRKKAHRYTNFIDLGEPKCAKHEKIDKAMLSIGTLGGGNHFIEIAEGPYILIHTGSRHLGAEVAKWYQDTAFAAHNDDSPYKMAWVDGSLMADYIHDVIILQHYAELSRKAVADEICRGKGNDDWNNSAPHGAGRLYSRSEVKEHFTFSQYKLAMKGIHSFCVDRTTLDECPMAYKPMEEIVTKIGPTVEIEHIIKPLYNFKAGCED